MIEKFKEALQYMEVKMICPIKNLGHLINPQANRIYSDECSKDCQLWDKDCEDCGLKAPREVKISGGINTHPY